MAVRSLVTAYSSLEAAPIGRWSIETFALPCDTETTRDETASSVRSSLSAGWTTHSELVLPVGPTTTQCSAVHKSRGIVSGGDGATRTYTVHVLDILAATTLGARKLARPNTCHGDNGQDEA